MPRRVRDEIAEEKFRDKYGYSRIFYRKVALDDENRGEEYPVFKAGIRTFAHFGIGVGIYFTQILLLFAVSFIGGLIMVTAVKEYSKQSYGINTSSNPFVPISAACPDAVNVTVTINCNNNEPQCSELLVPHCELPFYAAFSDMIMSLVFLAVIIGSKLIETEISDRLDEAIQTASDYSIVVNDPDPSADNPDEWYEFFSRFGKVRYVTISRRNHALTQLVALKHRITMKLLDINSKSDNLTGKDESKMKLREAKCIKDYAKVNEKLEKAYLQTYPTCRVYVTFEFEESKQLCMKELEVPDIYAILDLKQSHPRNMFRGGNVLDVSEPPEPDSVLWENIEIKRLDKMYYEGMADILTIAVLVGSYYIIDYTLGSTSLVLSIIIGFVDSLLPIILGLLTDYSSPQSEGGKQSNLQARLFLARLLLSTVFPFIRTAWNGMLNQEFVTQILSVQIVACFLSPLLGLLDIGGIIDRHLTGPMLSETQAELNSNWTGSQWSLAEKYTCVAKILFISLYYTLLNPISLLISMIAFLVLFLIDRFLLLRRWKACCMVGADIARRLRQQAILAVCFHMVVTYRFIYSWPMDNVYLNSDGLYEKVNKYPSLAIWTLHKERWHTEGQLQVLPMYYIATFVVVAITLYIWVFDPVVRSIRRLFCYQYATLSESQGIPFSSLSEVDAYVPTINHKNEVYLCSYVKDMLAKNKPTLMRSMPDDKDDLSSYVPIQHQPHILSIVKYYGDEVAKSSITGNTEDIERGGSGENDNGNSDSNYPKRLPPLDPSQLENKTAQSHHYYSHNLDHINDAKGSSNTDTTAAGTAVGAVAGLAGRDRDFILATDALPRYITNEDGILQRIVTGLPSELVSKIQGKTIPRKQYEAEKHNVSGLSGLTSNDGNLMTINNNTYAALPVSTMNQDATITGGNTIKSSSGDSNGMGLLSAIPEGKKRRRILRSRAAVSASTGASSAAAASTGSHYNNITSSFLGHRGKERIFPLQNDYDDVKDSSLLRNSREPLPPVKLTRSGTGGGSNNNMELLPIAATTAGSNNKINNRVVLRPLNKTY